MTMEGGSVAGGAAVSTTAQVADALAEMILSELSPGVSLPSEADLAVSYSVSRLTIREAIKILTGRGLLDVGRGRRAVVRQPDSAALADFLSDGRRRTNTLFDDLAKLAA